MAVMSVKRKAICVQFKFPSAFINRFMCVKHIVVAISLAFSVLSTKLNRGTLLEGILVTSECRSVFVICAFLRCVSFIISSINCYGKRRAKGMRQNVFSILVHKYSIENYIKWRRISFHPLVS